jgi:pimeloyl-ACP methyl ester carboxylesterase
VLGVSAPPVVLVHGWGGSFEETWNKPGVAALLSDAGRTVIGVDLLGHGTAPKPHDPAAYGDLGARVVEAMGDGPVDAVGFSLGAVTLLELAIDEPTRLNRLVLAGVGRNLFEDDLDRHRAIVEALTSTEPADGARDNVARLFTQYADQPGNDRKALTALMRRPRDRLFSPDRLSNVTCETLVVIGDRDFAGPGDLLVDALPNARLVTLRNCDHFATTEHFGFIDAMLEFLDALPA